MLKCVDSKLDMGIFQFLISDGDGLSDLIGVIVSVLLDLLDWLFFAVRLRFRLC